MKYALPHRPAIIIVCLFCISLSGALLAQRSVAELISEVLPASAGQIKYNDGVRQVNVHGNYLFITNFWAGLQVVDITDLRHPVQTAFLSSQGQAHNTAIEGNYAYMANHSQGVQVFDISDPAAVRQIAAIKTPGNAYWVTPEDSFLYTALGDDGFAIMDISDVHQSATVKLEIPGDWIQQLVKQGNLLYLAAKKGGLIIYDISDPEQPNKLSQYRTGFNTMMVQASGSTVYLADGAGGMLVMDVSDPAFPQEIARVRTDGFIGSLHQVGNYVYLANKELGLQIINIGDIEHPFLESTYPTDSNCYGVYKQDIYVFVAANTSALIMRHNNAPQLADIPDAVINENQLFRIQMEAQEPDGDPFQYEIINAPEGAQFDAETGLFQWTPTFEQSGLYPGIIFRVTEITDTRLSVSDTVTLTVVHVNRLPDLPPPPPMAVNENDTLQFTIEAGTDPDVEDRQNLSYRAEKLPEGARFDPQTRTFFWKPTFEQSGSYVVDFLMDDGAGGVDREPATITVAHVDRPPVIAAIEDQFVNEADTLTVQLSGTELDAEDQNAISFSMKNLPEGAVFDPQSRLFTWTPTYDQSGVYEHIRAIMTAGALSDSVEFGIRVAHVNRPPALNPIAAQSVDENDTLTIRIVGSDPDVEDAGKLTFSAANLPEGATFDPARQIFQWQPSYEQSGQYNELQFTVADPSGLSAVQRCTITVNHVNRPPLLAAVPEQTAAENQPLQIQLIGSDPDVEDQQKLIYSATGLPEGAQLNPQTGEFSWTPSYDQSGLYPITFAVSDGQYSAETATTVTVTHVNRPPSLLPLAAQSVDENQLLLVSVQARDPDREDQGKLVLTVAGLPAGAVFDAAGGSLSWTPSYEQSGVYQVVFQVADPAGLTDQNTLTITVNHVNRPPALAEIPAQVVDENQPLTISLSGSDPDREDAGKLSYEVEQLPGGATINPATGVLSWTPTYDQSGQYEWTARVKDPAGLSAEQPVSITVNNVNRPPKFTAQFVTTGAENSPIIFLAAANDPDKEDQGKLIYSAEGLPPGAQLDPGNGEFRWTPTFEQSGDYQITFKVSDTFGATDQAVVGLHIAHVNRQPGLPAPAPAIVAENNLLSLVLPEGSDPDAEDVGKLTYRVDNLPAGAVFDPAARSLSWTPGFDQAGEYVCSYVVADPAGLSATQALKIKVDNVNRPPQLTPVAAITVAENQPVQFSLGGSDPDQEDQGKLRYRCESLPKGANLDKQTGGFTWTPSYEQSGNYALIFEVKDSFGETAVQTVNITVTHVNRPPQVGQAGPFKGKENQAFSAVLPAAKDPDSEDAGKLSYTLTGLPEGASFDAASRRIQWTPGFEQAGRYTFVYKVSDGAAEVEQQVELVIEDRNRAPQLSGASGHVVKEGEELRFSVSANDPDPEDQGNLKLSAKHLPDGASFDAGSGEFRWTPGPDQQGNYTVEFIVKDRAGDSAKLPVSISVEDAPIESQSP